MLINGTTSGILSVIQAFSEEKGRYLISRNVHKSVFHGLDLAKAQAQATFTAMHQSNLTCQYVEPILEDVIEDYKLVFVHIRIITEKHLILEISLINYMIMAFQY